MSDVTALIKYHTPDNLVVKNMKLILLICLLLISCIDCVECKQWTSFYSGLFIIYNTFFEQLNLVFWLLGAKSDLTIEVLSRMIVAYNVLKLETLSTTILDKIILCMKHVIAQNSFADTKKNKCIFISKKFTTKEDSKRKLWTWTELKDVYEINKTTDEDIPLFFNPEILCDETGKCPLCFEPCQDETMVTLECNHKFHYVCISNIANYCHVADIDFKCPVCDIRYPVFDLLDCGVVFCLEDDYQDYKNFGEAIWFEDESEYPTDLEISDNYDECEIVDMIQTEILKKFADLFDLGETKQISGEQYLLCKEYYNDTIYDDPSCEDYQFYKRLNQEHRQTRKRKIAELSDDDGDEFEGMGRSLDDMSNTLSDSGKRFEFLKKYLEKKRRHNDLKRLVKDKNVDAKICLQQEGEKVKKQYKFSFDARALQTLDKYEITHNEAEEVNALLQDVFKIFDWTCGSI